MRGGWLLCAAALAWGGESVAIVKKVAGDVQLKRSETYRVLTPGSSLEAGDTLITAKNGSAGVAFRDGTVVSVGPKSHFVLNRYRFRPAKGEYDFDVSLRHGSAAVETGKIGKLAPKNVSFNVPQGSVGIRGTKFLVDVEE